MYYGKVLDKRTGKPLSGIRMSDGLNTVLTDSDGSYRLCGWERAHLIYANILTSSHDDWYHCITEGRENYDFFLTPSDAAEDEFSFLHISDTEFLSDADSDEWISFAKDTTSIHSPAFFVQTGDIAREYGLRKHRKVMNYDTVGCPVRYTIGNHDFQDGAYGEELYERLYGPTWYSFDVAGTRFVVLSMVSLGGTEKPTGYMLDDQWKWLANDLRLKSPDARLIVMCHNYCALDPIGFRPTVEGITYDLRSSGLLAWVHGHKHTNDLHEHGGVFSIGSSRPDSGGVDSSEGSIRKITVDGDRLSSEMIYFMPYEIKKDAFLWETKLPGKINFCTPLHVGESIYLGTVDDGYPKDCGIFKISTEGELLWSYKTRDSITGPLAYSDGKIYAQDNRGRVYCISEDGERLWIKDELLYGNSYTRGGVIVAEGLVIAAGSRDTIARDKNTGETVWSHRYQKGTDSPARTVYDEKRHRVIVSINWYAILSFDIKSGRIEWICDDDRIWFRTSTPLLLGDSLYVMSRGNAIEINAENGEIIRSKPVDDTIFEVSSCPLYHEGLLYVPTANKGVISIDTETLSKITVYPSDNANLFTSPYLFGEVETVESTPVIMGDTLVFTTLGGTVRFYRIGCDTPSRVVSIGSPSLHSPIFKDSEMLVMGFDGFVTSFGI